MKLAMVILSIVLEILFIVYFIHMTYLIDVVDSFPKDMMIPNMLAGAVVLGFGYFVMVRMNRSTLTIAGQNQSGLE